MADPKAVRLRQFEESYVESQSKPFSDLVREPLVQNIVSDAGGVCTATGLLQFESTLLDEPDRNTLLEWATHGIPTPYRDITQEAVTTDINREDRQRGYQIDNNTNEVALYPFSSQYDVEYNGFSLEFEDIWTPVSKDIDTHLLWVVETMAIDTAGGKSWDYIISLLTALSEYGEDITEDEMLSIAYMRGLAMLEMLGCMATRGDIDSEMEDIVTNLFDWLAAIEEIYAPPAHRSHNQYPGIDLREMDMIAGVSQSESSDCYKYAESMLEYDVSIQPSQVVLSPAGGDQRKFDDDSVHSLEWRSVSRSGESSESDDPMQMYPASAALNFVQFTSKSLTEWFVDFSQRFGYAYTQTQPDRLRVGDRNDSQDKFVVVPAGIDPTWVSVDGQYILIDEISNGGEILGSLDTADVEYVSSDVFDAWCRYDDGQEVWSVYSVNNSHQLTYDTKQALIDEWQFVQQPQENETNQADMVDSSSIGEIGLPHQVDEILIGRQIYQHARKNYASESESNGSSMDSGFEEGDKPVGSTVAQLRDVMNRVATDDVELCFIDPKGESQQELPSQFPKPIVDNITWVGSEDIDSKTVSSLTMLEPDFDSSHPRYDDRVESIAEGVIKQAQIGMFWGPQMAGFVKDVVRAMVRSERLYMVADLYEVLSSRDARSSFVDEIRNEGVCDDANMDRDITTTVDLLTNQLDQIEKETIEPVLRRLQSMIENPEDYDI